MNGQVSKGCVQRHVYMLLLRVALGSELSDTGQNGRSFNWRVSTQLRLVLHDCAAIIIPLPPCPLMCLVVTPVCIEIYCTQCSITLQKHLMEKVFHAPSPSTQQSYHRQIGPARRLHHLMSTRKKSEGVR